MDQVLRSPRLLRALLSIPGMLLVVAVSITALRGDRSLDAAPLAGEARRSDFYVDVQPESQEFSGPQWVNIRVEACLDWDLWNSSIDVYVDGQSRSLYFEEYYDSDCPGTYALAEGEFYMVENLDVYAFSCDGAYDWCDSDEEFFTAPDAGLPVEVTPIVDLVIAPPTAPSVVGFNVYNPRGVDASFNVQVICAGRYLACWFDGPSVFVPAGQTTSINVAYTLDGTPHDTLTLTAKLSDASGDLTNVGQGSLTVVSPEPAYSPNPIVPGTVVTRDQCLTIAAGSAAAYECGDLRLSHALPTVRTLNKDRTPILTYNSQHAHPYPIVRTDVQLPGSDPLPDAVTALLTVNGQAQPLRTWPGSAWGGPGSTRRVAVALDGLTAGLQTGLHPYTLEIRRMIGGGTSVLKTETGFIPVVNRSTSPFGAGWWLAGMEELLFLPGNQIMWVGGDGSVRRYDPKPGTSSVDVWVAASVTHPDTIVRTKSSTGTTPYRRLLPSGNQVEFDPLGGRHLRTVNRQGHATVFTTVSGKLTKISMPPAASPFEYRFHYSASGVIDSVSTFPTTGTTRTRFYKQGYLLDSISDYSAQGGTVGFRYQGATNLVTSRIDRRGTPTGYAYDAALRLRQSGMHPGGTADSIVVRFCAAETRGLSDCSPSPVHPDSAYTVFDGARRETSTIQDTTRFWINQFGGPDMVRDALGNVTRVNRGDPRWPALATRIEYPKTRSSDARGQVISATYNGRGNIAWTVDSATVVNGVYAKTRHRWNTEDRLTETVQPEGEKTYFIYDGLGRLFWQQDGRGPSSRVTFNYNSLSLVSSTAIPGLTTRDSVEYDAKGNVIAMRTRIGNWTTIKRDVMGRDSVISTPIDDLDRSRTPTSRPRATTIKTYWPNGLLNTQRDSGPAMSSHGAQVRLTRTYFDAERNHTSTVIAISPDPNNIGLQKSYTYYDLANRDTAAMGPDRLLDIKRYDPAGNVIESITRRGHLISTSYDALNRMSQRITPGVVRTDTTFGAWAFPTITNCGYTLGWCMPADTAEFRYDGRGNMILADNHDARVRRGYNPNGTLAVDSLNIATYDGGFTRAPYVTEMRYDRNGRRTWLRYPQGLGATSIADTLVWTYDPYTGQLATVRDLFGKLFKYTENLRGELDSISYPAPGPRKHTYDLDSRLKQVTQQRPGFSTNMGITYDARDKRLGLSGTTGSTCGGNFSASYTGLGMLRRSQSSCYEKSNDEAMLTDALGNVSGYANDFHISDAWEPVRGWHERSYWYDGTGRLSSTYTSTHSEMYLHWDMNNLPFTEGSISDANRYDASGNRVWHSSAVHEQQWIPQYEYRERWDEPGVIDTVFMGYFGHPYEPATNASVVTASYYDAANKLRVSDKRSNDEYVATTIFEEYRYDALGRRVMRRTRGPSGCSDPALCIYYGMERFIWDGSQILAEIRVPGRSGVSSSILESDTPPAGVSRTFWGRVLYVPGLEVDQPITTARIGYAWKYNGNMYEWAPLSLTPDWDLRGRAYGFAFYAGQQCLATNVCVGVRWPSRLAWGDRFRNYKVTAAENESIGGWFGSLIEDQRDASGTLYRRNRYYDPTSGRFTQEDPIGLAGGLNVYGFANGDPINFSDPFGLCPYGGKPTLTTNLSDCPQRNPQERALYGMFQVMATTALGEQMIGVIVSEKVPIRVGKAPCGRAALGCWKNGEMLLNLRSDVQMATTAVHETVHVIQAKGKQRMSDDDALVQLPAYAVQFAFYRGLPAEKQNDPEYSLWAERFRVDPVAAGKRLCGMLNFYNCP